MNKTLLLFRTMFRSEDVLEIKTERTGRIKTLFKLIGMLVILLIAGFSFAPIIAELYAPLKQFGMAELLPKLVLYSASLVVLVFAFFYVMSVFYYSTDIENYLYLPVKPGSLVLAKFMVVGFYEILSTIAMFYPSLIVFGVLDRQGIGYYLKSFLTMILLPVAPLAIMAILCMILMRFSKIFRNKDRFTLVSSLIGIFIAVTVSNLMQRLSTSLDNGIPVMLQSEGPLVTILSLVFPAATLMYNAIFGDFLSLLLNTALTLAVIAGFLAVFYVVGNHLYIDGAKGLKESGMKRRDLTASELTASTRRSSVLLAIAGKELKTLVRTPPYFLNCILVTLILPVFIIMPFFFGSGMEELTLLFGEGGIAGLRQVVLPEHIIIGLMAIMAFYAGINLIAATAISREGSNFSFMKYIPVPYQTQFMAKILPALAVELVGVLILLIPAIIILRPSALSVLIGLILGSLLSLVLNLAMLAVDIIKPVLNWTSEQKAVKQNFNAMVSTFLSMIVGAIPVALYFFVPLDPWLLFGIEALLLSLLLVLLYRQLPILAERSFRDRP